LSAASIARLVVIAVISALTIVRLRKDPIPRDELVRRLPRCLAGLACFGLGIALFFASRLGVGPWDVLHGGLAKRLHLPVGVVINLVGLVVLLLWIPLREPIGLGTALNALEIGFVLDLVRPLIPETDRLVPRVLFCVAGLVVIALGSGMYLGSGLGAGPRDGVMMGLSRLGLSIRAARSIVELVTLAVGYLLGGSIGFGTVLFLVGIGPLVQIFMSRLRLPPLRQSGHVPLEVQIAG
jgi:uncharacterized membrane protein YczE